MAQLPLLGGAYTASSLIANAQRCVNLYPEKNPESAQAPVPVTHYQTPGLVLRGTPPKQAVCRCLYRATNGDLYAVIGDTVYYVDSGFNFTGIGQIDYARSLVSMVDNGIDIFGVDGSIKGFTINLSTRTFSTIIGNGYQGADHVDYVNTFFVFNKPATNQFYISSSFGTDFDDLDIAAKSGGNDPIVSVIVMRREIWLIGALTTEVWVGVEDAQFAFQASPGVFIDHGCIAKFSPVQFDKSIFWLAQDRAGQSLVVRGSADNGYGVERISTHAIEKEIQDYARQDDATGFVYQKDGHTFYCLTFPAADKTWCYDLATGQWHERAWLDDNGVMHRHRANCCAFAYNTVLVGDWETGKIYALDSNTYTDDGRPIERLRSFPHLINESNRVGYLGFTANIETGTYLGEEEPEISLRWSDTRGRSWGSAIMQSMGATGEYLTDVQWSRLGQARDRVFELSWSANMRTALNGAFIDTEASDS